MRRILVLCLLFSGAASMAAGLLLAGCSSEEALESIEASEAADPEKTMKSFDLLTQEGAFAPDLAGAGDRLTLTWLEPADSGHALRLATLQGEIWSSPRLVAEGDGFFANWADLPKAISTNDGTLFAHWLSKLGEDTYAYGIQLARSRDGGTTWEELGWLHDDTSPTEHGFVSYAALPEGGAQAFCRRDGVRQRRRGYVRPAASGPHGSVLCRAFKRRQVEPDQRADGP